MSINHIVSSHGFAIARVSLEKEESEIIEAFKRDPASMLECAGAFRLVVEKAFVSVDLNDLDMLATEISAMVENNVQLGSAKWFTFKFKSMRHEGFVMTWSNSVSSFNELVEALRQKHATGSNKVRDFIEGYVADAIR
jgi:hypothetical protein